MPGGRAEVEVVDKISRRVYAHVRGDFAFGTCAEGRPRWLKARASPVMLAPVKRTGDRGRIRTGEKIAMATAVASDLRTQMYIDGKWCDAQDGRTLAVINPADES